MKAFLIVALAASLAAQVAAQPSMMPGMAMPQAKPAAPKPAAAKLKPAAKPAAAPKAKPAADPHAGHEMGAMPGMAPAAPAAPAVDPHDGHNMGAMPGVAPAAPATPAADPHAGHNMGAMQGMAAVPAEEIGTTPAPSPPTDHAADAIWGAAAQAPSRQQLRDEHGNFQSSFILFNIAEYVARKGADGYRWEAEGWFGGDVNRLVVRTEGEGDIRGATEKAEVQALYSWAFDPWWNWQIGVRQDIRPNPQRTFAVASIEGLAPYWFRTVGAIFLSNKGELTARAEGFYDQRVTQRLILQPRGEINFSAQRIPELGSGAGVTDIELGMRLRYEVRREFAPYVGVEWVSKVGDSARFARAAGESPSFVHVVAGIRAWF